MAATAGLNGYGTFEINAGVWTYRLDNASALVQGIDAGEAAVDSFVFTATDGTILPVTIFLSGQEDAPTLDNALVDQIAINGTAFSYQFAVNSFSDADLSDTLTYTAELSNGDPLPTWLFFDDSTRTFSGTPAIGDVGVIDVRVLADDGESTKVRWWHCHFEERR